MWSWRIGIAAPDRRCSVAQLMPHISSAAAFFEATVRQSQHSCRSTPCFCAVYCVSAPRSQKENLGIIAVTHSDARYHASPFRCLLVCVCESAALSQLRGMQPPNYRFRVWSITLDFQSVNSLKKFYEAFDDKIVQLDEKVIMKLHFSEVRGHTEQDWFKAFYGSSKAKSTIHPPGCIRRASGRTASSLDRCALLHLE